MSGDEEGEISRSDRHDGENFYDGYTDEELDEKSQVQLPASYAQPHNMHFRSFSHDGHLNHYTMAPTSHMNINGMRAGTPPNEDEEDHRNGGDNEHSPIDSDGSHSYHDEIPTSYVHQPSYQTMSSAQSALAVSSTGELVSPKDAMTIMHGDMQKDYINNQPLMDPSMMSEGWGYQ
jgi:hypothetical protein